jgi:biopolymer transport protein ExbD
MAINLGHGSSQDDDVMVEINTTPLIDVMLVLLIMLIITIPIQTHAVKINMPVGNPPPPLVQPRVIQVDVDFDGTVLWDGEVVPDRAHLEDRMRQVSAQADQPEIHLRPNKLVAYKVVAMVMATAQRLGVTKIGLVGNEQFVN